MKLNQAASFVQLQSAYTYVQRELVRAGLWYDGKPLTRTEVILCADPPPDLNDAAGFFVNVTHRFYKASGFDPGHIYIPKWVLKPGARQSRGSLRDVLRHEFAHALAFYYPGLIRRNRAFVAAFAARYDDPWPHPPTEPGDFVTDYAMTSPDEDFAETFMVWLRGFSNPNTRVSRLRGCPSRRITSALRAKFQFVRSVCRRLAK